MSWRFFFFSFFIGSKRLAKISIRLDRYGPEDLLHSFIPQNQGSIRQVRRTIHQEKRKRKISNFIEPQIKGQDEILSFLALGAIQYALFASHYLMNMDQNQSFASMNFATEDGFSWIQTIKDRRFKELSKRILVQAQRRRLDSYLFFMVLRG